MTRSELIAGIAISHPQLRRADIELIVTTIFDQITDALAHGGRVELRGFGAFAVKRRNARRGHNPRTGELVSVPEKPLLFFKPARDCATGSIASRASQSQCTRRNLGTLGICFNRHRLVSCSGAGPPCNAVAHEQQTWLVGRSLVAGDQRRAVGAATWHGETPVPALSLLLRRRSHERRATLPGRIAAASASVTTNIAGAWGRVRCGRQAQKDGSPRSRSERAAPEAAKPQAAMKPSDAVNAPSRGQRLNRYRSRRRSSDAKARNSCPALSTTDSPLTAAVLSAIPVSYTVVTQPSLALVLLLAELTAGAPLRIRIVLTPIGVTTGDCNARRGNLCDYRRNQRKTGRTESDTRGEYCSH